MTLPRPYEIVWKGPIHRASGLGVASRAYVKALRQLGIRVTTQSGSRLPRSAQRRVLIYHHSPANLNIQRERKQYKTIVVNTVWETTRIPHAWVRKLNQTDGVCVPSRQNKQALLHSGVRVPVFIVPHGVDARLYTPQTKPSLPGAHRPFTFISVFGFQHRKNPEALLRAYWEEFSPDDNVLLLIKTSGYAPAEDERWILNRIQGYKDQLNLRERTAPLQVITRRLDPGALRRLYARGNAFVLPTRGEGVGLPFLESMASGVPAIATGWGGHMDFLTPTNSFVIDYQLRPPVLGMNQKTSISRQFRYLFTEEGQLWAEPDIRSLRREMRRAYDNPGLCWIKGQQARHDALQWSWSRAGLAFKKAIEASLSKRFT